MIRMDENIVSVPRTSRGISTLLFAGILTAISHHSPRIVTLEYHR
jgi:hypothetical protein